MNDNLRTRILKITTNWTRIKIHSLLYDEKKALNILFLGPPVGNYFCSIVQYSQTLVL